MSDSVVHRELLRDLFTRLIEHVDELTDGLTDDEANYRPAPERQQRRLADLAQRAGAGRSARPDRRRRAGVDRRGVGRPVRPCLAAQRHRLRPRPAEVAKVQAPVDLLAGYYHAVHKLTLEFVAASPPKTWSASSTETGIHR